MFSSSDEVLKYIKDEGVKFVDVRFIDLPGVMQHFNMPVESFDQAVFDDGLMFDGSSIRGFQAIHESDMKLIPDPATAFIDPFRPAKTLVMNFSIRDPFTNEQYSRDPRNVAAKAEAYLKSTGIADTVYFGPEAEFYVFDDIRFDDIRPVGLFVFAENDFHSEGLTGDEIAMRFDGLAQVCIVRPDFDGDAVGELALPFFAQVLDDADRVLGDPLEEELGG